MFAIAYSPKVSWQRRIAAPQDRSVIRAPKILNGAFRAAALLREGSISVRLLCVMLFYRYLKFFLDLGVRMVRGPEPIRAPDRHVGTGEWDSSCGCYLRRRCNARGISLPAATVSRASSSSARANQDAEEENCHENPRRRCIGKGQA